MVKLHDGGVYLVNGETLVPEAEAAKVEQMTGIAVAKEEAKKGTIAYGIMKAHNQSDNMDKLQIKFDAMVSHDITFVGIIQTARSRSGWSACSPAKCRIPAERCVDFYPSEYNHISSLSALDDALTEVA